MNRYIVATIKPWHINAFNQRKNQKFKHWTLVSSPQDFTGEMVLEINPRYIFFPHWSWIVPDEIIQNFDCVCFHSSDVPYARGGSPIQNLIIRGYQETKISALKMVKELDAGPVYLKRPLSLQGRAQEIYERSAEIIVDMMYWIAAKEIEPIPQMGDPITFKRRTSTDNLMPLDGNLSDLYNHIRMLDADTYPSSFIEYGEFKMEFSEADFREKDVLSAKVNIRRRT